MPTTITNPKTLNQIINNFRVIADLHLQINDFKYGDAWEFYQSGTSSTPELWLTCESINRLNNVSEYNLRIYVVDNVKRGESNETEVESDLIQICEDIIAQIRDHNYEWNVLNSQNIVIEVKTEQTPKNLTAAQFSVTIRVPKPDDICAIPFSSNPLTGAQSNSSLVVIYNQETNETIAALAAGSRYPVLVFSGIRDEGPPYTNSIIGTT